ncbi:hypothetical protein BH10ACI1_BH10ACI1_23380 [soil metagenome]
MKQIISSAILILSFCLAAFAQANENQCPKIKFISPNQLISSDEPTIFEVKVGEETEKLNLSYEWTFSKGKILRGQGTSQIEFLAMSENEKTVIDVSVKIIGLPKDCSNTYSDVYVVASRPIYEPLISFGKLKNSNEYLACIDVLFIELNNNSSYEGLIIIRFVKSDSRNYKILYLKKIRRLINFRKYDITRLTFAISERDSEEYTTFLVGQSFAKLQEDYLKDGYKIIKGEELEQRINELFPKLKTNF